MKKTTLVVIIAIVAAIVIFSNLIVYEIGFSDGHMKGFNSGLELGRSTMETQFEILKEMERRGQR